MYVSDDDGWMDDFSSFFPSFRDRTRFAKVLGLIVLFVEGGIHRYMFRARRAAFLL